MGHPTGRGEKRVVECEREDVGEVVKVKGVIVGFGGEKGDSL